VHSALCRFARFGCVAPPIISREHEASSCRGRSLVRPLRRRRNSGGVAWARKARQPMHASCSSAMPQPRTKATQQAASPTRGFLHCARGRCGQALLFLFGTACGRAATSLDPGAPRFLDAPASLPALAPVQILQNLKETPLRHRWPRATLHWRCSCLSKYRGVNRRAEWKHERRFFSRRLRGSLAF